MIINLVSEIDKTDEKILELVKITNQFGMSEMYEVCMTYYEVAAHNNKKVAFVVTQETAWETIRTILACAVILYASWKHEVFEVALEDKEEAEPVRFTRIDGERHLRDAETYMNHAKILIEKYYPSEFVL